MYNGLPKTCLDSGLIAEAPRQRRTLGCWKHNITDEFKAIPRQGVCIA